MIGFVLAFKCFSNEVLSPSKHGRLMTVKKTSLRHVPSWLKNSSKMTSLTLPVLLFFMYAILPTIFGQGHEVAVGPMLAVHLHGPCIPKCMIIFFQPHALFDKEALNRNVKTKQKTILSFRD